MRWWFDVLSLFQQYLSHGNSILAMEKWDDDGLSFYDPFNNISVLEDETMMVCGEMRWRWFDVLSPFQSQVMEKWDDDGPVSRPLH